MTADQRLHAARAFWRDEQAGDDQLQAIILIAQVKKFRAKTVVGLDEERKTRHLAGLPSLPDGLAARALIVYHLAEQREMMGAFLDLLGIAHEKGVIDSESVKPEPEKLSPAVDALFSRFPEENVLLYLETLLCQDPQTWQELANVPRLAAKP
jgi:hypothetical protein